LLRIAPPTQWTTPRRPLKVRAMSTTAPDLKPGDHLFLVDGSNFIFRAYFQSINQDRKYLSRSDGLPSGAVRLFATKLFQFVREGVLGVRPTHLAIVFDKTENSFRKALYPAYKGNRSEPPPDLIPQFPLMREAVRAFGLIPVEQDVYEADDLIATYAKQAREAGADVLIVSADKDLMQLVRPGVAMYDPASGDAKKGAGFRAERRIGEPEVVEYFGVTPDKVVDVQALAGDATDNVPGAPGIGIKTAAQLIGEFGDLETLLARAGEIKQPKRRETLTNPEVVEKVRISHKLVTLVDDVAVETPLSHLTLSQPDPARLVAFLKAMEFTTITKRVAEAYEVDVAAVDADPALAPGGSRAAELKALYAGADLPAIDVAVAVATDGETTVAVAVATPGTTTSAAPAREGWLMPADLVAQRRDEVAKTPIDRSTYECVRTLADLTRWIGWAYEAGHVALDTETNSLDAMQADLVGISLAVAPGKACYIPLQHRGGTDLFGGGMLEGQIPLTDVVTALKPLLADPGVLKIGQNLKYDLLVLQRHGLPVSPIEDTMLISYALDAGNNNHGMDRLAELHLGHETIPYSQVAGTGKAQVTFDKVDLEKATAYAAEDADVTLRLWRTLRPRLTAEGKTAVYEVLERPLVAVLARMESRGIAIDRQILSRLSGEFAQSLARLEDEIYTLAGEKFTIGSPKQLGDILFGKMGLAGAKKTATGQWATGAGVLEDLAEQGHELPSKILEWRQLAKLKSTYTDSLPAYVNPQTNRVHTSYALAATTTGRLSSSEPNLQNIPIRTEAGRKIRTAFIASSGHKLVSADYSQIELRILAHIADIPQLRQAFADGIDIHAMTASEMFGVPVAGMPSEVRRRAKAINFGIIYGISAFGLANQLGIGREEAGAYIRKYFERFPGIRDYMDQTKTAVRANGKVTTIFGRVCHFPAVASKNPSERAFVERQAINAPIQGSAADIIRRAMIRMEGALADAKLDARMLLQVHDELVFEVPDAQVEATLPVISKVMVEAPHPAVQLRVPLQVDARAAGNWDEAH
jgi:DNA polymerase-1